jgi:hypothetical protein
MGLIEGYLLFALTTTIVALYELYIPVMRDLSISHPNLPSLRYRGVVLVVFSTFAFVTAPLMVLPCLIPTMGTRFRDALVLSLTQG